MRLSAGQTIGRYVIESLLGEGGMGEVYRARDSKLKRSVALKVLRNQDGVEASESWEHAVIRMQREAQAVAALSHPGIVAIYDIGEHDGIPFIAMELVAGKPLRDFIGTEMPMPIRLRILLDVARALAAAHEAGFVHRDIKPENILIRPDNSSKILDFGIARQTSHPAEQATAKMDVHGTTIDAAAIGITADGALIGTPAYMAPEQLRGEAVDARADQFAWGVVAYELIAAKHPFRAEQGMMLLMASILGDTPPPLEGVPDGIANLLRRALEKDPADRWASMEEIVSSWPLQLAEEVVRHVQTGSSGAHVITQNQTHSQPQVPQRKSFPRFFRVAVVIVTVVLIVGVWLSRRYLVVNTASSAIASVSAAPSAAPTGIVDLPIPSSNSAEARAAFREGLQASRDARMAAAATAFQRARVADPEMAAAHLRYALIQFAVDLESSRAAFRTAYGLRGVLSERDAAFLQAVEPIIQRDPSDYSTASQRLQTLVDRYPQDAELLFWYGRSVSRIGSDSEFQSRAVEIMNRCTASDPQYANCWLTKAVALLLMNRVDESIGALNTCNVHSDGAIDCLQQKLALEASLGRCNHVLEVSRQLTAKDSMAPIPRRLYTEALYFSGATEPAVRAAAAEAVRVYRNQKLDFEANEMDTFADLGFGELATARRKLEALTGAVASEPAKQADLILTSMLIYAEMEQWKEGAAVAQATLQKSSFDTLPQFPYALDPSMVLHSTLLQGGKISRKEYEKRRLDWLAKHSVTTSWGHIGQWFVTYAMPATSKDLAEEALAEFDRVPMPADLNQSALHVLLSAFRGRLLVTAGKHQEAIAHLEKGVRMCTQTISTVMYIQSLAALGVAYETTGDSAAACRAYTNVLSRWGSSKDSRTAKDVAQRAKKLGCDHLVK